MRRMVSFVTRHALAATLVAGLALPGGACAQETESSVADDCGDCEVGDEFWYMRASPGVTLFVHEIGAGEPVVVLHGGPGADHSYMHGVARDLTDEFRFIFYDQRGSLRSTERGEVTYTIQDHVADLEALRAALGVERIHILGHSAGTTLAYHYLDAHPDRVGNLLLAGAVHPLNGSPGVDVFDDEDRARFSQRQELFDEFLGRPPVTDAIHAAGLDSPVTQRDSARLAVLRQFAADVYHVERWNSHVPLRINNDVAQLTQQSIDWNYDRRDLLNAHPHGVTVVNGEYDYVIGSRGSPLWRKLAANYMPDVEVEVLPEAGHNAWLDQPGMFADAVRKALRR